jgi:hypothetical protein
MGKGLSGDLAAALAAKLDAAGEKDLSMTKADPGDIGPDGTVRLLPDDGRFGLVLGRLRGFAGVPACRADRHSTRTAPPLVRMSAGRRRSGNRPGRCAIQATTPT